MTCRVHRSNLGENGELLFLMPRFKEKRLSEAVKLDLHTPVQFRAAGLRLAAVDAADAARIWLTVVQQLLCESSFWSRALLRLRLALITHWLAGCNFKCVS